MAPGVKGARHQPLGELDHRARVHPGTDPPRGRVPPDVEDRVGDAIGCAPRCGSAASRRVLALALYTSAGFLIALGASADPADHHHRPAGDGVPLRTHRRAVEHASAAGARRGVPAALRRAAAAPARRRPGRRSQPSASPAPLFLAVRDRGGDRGVRRARQAHAGSRGHDRSGAHDHGAGHRSAATGAAGPTAPRRADRRQHVSTRPRRPSSRPRGSTT